MVDIQEKSLPESGISLFSNGDKGFTKISMLLEATGGLSLSQVCAVTGLEGSTIQNWVKRGWVAHPKGKKYEEIHVARILIINALKECIKLEHITLLMSYVNGSGDESEHIIKESVLYNYLCDALSKLGDADDLSQSGVEAVVETVISDFSNPAPFARFRIRKALSVMIYACVCTDVKRRTETMMEQVLHELEYPESIDESEYANLEAKLQEKNSLTLGAITPESPAAQQVVLKESPIIQEETRKTVAQALREWDIARAGSDNAENEDMAMETKQEECDGSGENETDENEQIDSTQTQPQRPWYFRRN